MKNHFEFDAAFNVRTKSIISTRLHILHGNPYRAQVTKTKNENLAPNNVITIESIFHSPKIKTDLRSDREGSVFGRNNSTLLQQFAIGFQFVHQQNSK